MDRAGEKKSKSSKKDILREKLDAQSKALKKVLAKLEQKIKDKNDQIKEEEKE
jgi:hypothetical protein